jgi:signal transduction histidine kinase
VRLMRSISTKIGIAFVLVALVPLSAALTIAYISSQEALTEEVQLRLSVISKNKANRIEGYLGGLQREVVALSTSPDLLGFAGRVHASDPEVINNTVEGYSGSFDYSNLFVFSADGVIVGSAGGNMPVGQSVLKGPLLVSDLGRAVANLIALPNSSAQGPVLTRFSKFGVRGDLESFVLAPMVFDNVTVGVIAAQVNKARLFNIVNERTGLGESGEIFLLRSSHDQAELMESTVSGPVMRTSSLEYRDFWSLENIRDGNMRFSLVNPDGEAVVASIDKVPSYNWYLLVSIRESEAYAGVLALGSLGFLILTVTTLCVIVVSFFVGRAVTIPIRALTEATRRIAEGDLGERVATVGQDETALLGNDFNHMIDLISDYRSQIETSLEQKTDLSNDLKVANERLTNALKRAELASHSKSEFLANMSHEIRTPLNGVLGLTELMIDENPEIKQKEKLEIVRKCGQSLLDILNDILDISKLEAGRIELNIEGTNLQDLMNLTIDTFNFRAEEKGIGLKANIGSDVPEVVNIDPVRVRQILFNLLGNAVKFTNAGSVHINVDLTYDDAFQKMIQISVIDTGIGISEDARSVIFDRFSQANSTTSRVYGGTGLGLTICKQLTDLMDGKIWVESDVGRGSIFRLLVPFADETVVPFPRSDSA